MFSLTPSSAVDHLGSACSLPNMQTWCGPLEPWVSTLPLEFTCQEVRGHLEEAMTFWYEDRLPKLLQSFFFSLFLSSHCLSVYLWLEWVDWHFSLCWENSLFAMSKKEGRKQVADRSEGVFVSVSPSECWGRCWQPLNIYCRDCCPLVILLMEGRATCESPTAQISKLVLFDLAVHYSRIPWIQPN